MAKLLPGNETVLLIPAVIKNGIPHLTARANGATVPISAPTKAILDPYIAQRAPVARGLLGGNISEAIRDDLQLGMTASQTSNSRAITSIGANEQLTFFNFQANFNFFRDENAADLGAYNLARISTRAQGVPYVIAHRVGARQTAVATVGEKWDFYYALTGQPVPGYSDGEELMIGQNFVPKNILNVAYAI